MPPICDRPFSRDGYMAFATKRYIRYRPPMYRTITQRELRNDSAAVLREVQAGQIVIVTRNGVPVAELRPIQPRRFVPRAVIAEAAARAPRLDARRFRADLDAVIDQSVDG
jgi:prevent-host-death family protein